MSCQRLSRMKRIIEVLLRDPEAIQKTLLHSGRRFRLRITQIFTLVFLSLLLISTLTGCEAFVRKFTRKTKKSKEAELPVLSPKEYLTSDIPKEERYRRYFVFWKSWQDELITALGSSASYKKRQSCLKEAIKNLAELKPFLFEEKQKELDYYLEKLKQLQQDLSKDIYGTKSNIYKGRAESLKRDIWRNFAYSNVEGHLR
jgi:hypothetical protein